MPLNHFDLITPFMEKSIKNFHFVFGIPPLSIFQADEQCGGETRDKGRIEKDIFKLKIIKKVDFNRIFS